MNENANPQTKSLWLEKGVFWWKRMTCPSQGDQGWDYKHDSWQWFSKRKAGYNLPEATRRNAGQAETLAITRLDLSQSHMKPCKSMWKERSQKDRVDVKALTYILSKAHCQKPLWSSCQFHRHIHITQKKPSTKFITIPDKNSKKPKHSELMIINEGPRIRKVKGILCKSRQWERGIKSNCSTMKRQSLGGKDHFS